MSANNLSYIEMIAEAAFKEFMHQTHILRTGSPAGAPKITNVVNSWKTGETQKIAIPMQFQIYDGLEITDFSPLIDQFIDYKVDFIKTIATQAKIKELTFKGRAGGLKYYGAGKGLQIAREAEVHIASKMALQTNRSTGTAGVQITDPIVIMEGINKCNQLGVHPEYLFMDPKNYASLVSERKLIENYNKEINTEINRHYGLSLYLGLKVTKLPGFSIFQEAGVGDGTSTPADGYVDAGTIEGTFSTGNTLVIKGLSENTTPFKKGDRIYVEGVNLLDNTASSSDTGDHYQMVVSEDVVLGAGETQATVTLTRNFLYDGTGKNPYRDISTAFTTDQQVKLVTANTGAGSTTKKNYSISLMYDSQGFVRESPELEEISGCDNYPVFDSIRGLNILGAMDGDFKSANNMDRVSCALGSAIQSDRFIALLGA